MKKALILYALLLVGGLAALGIDGKREVQGAEFDVPAFLKAHVQVEIQNGLYTYRIINTELKQFIAAFHLDIKDVPITVVGMPLGWKPETDGQTYVMWFAENYDHMVPAGKSLGGFQIQSPTQNSVTTPYSLVGFDRTLDDAAGKATFGSVASPSR